MNFDFYDIFSKVIPGGLLIFVLIACGYFVPTDKMPEFAYLFFSYIVGFLIDAIAAKRQVMGLIWYLFRGKTSDVLLSGRKFYGNDYKFLGNLKSKVGEDWKPDDLARTFDFIYRKVLTLDAKRVQGFNNHWINTRNLLVSLIISAIPLAFFIWNGQRTWLVTMLSSSILLFCIGMIFDRAKGRQYYFVKEVLDSYLFLEKNKGCP